ncbi:MAG: fumarylacetoacetate hydrolase family protein, partial [Nocardia sp.]|nr:fumarylacetoacetate hydrolase family protein [Nocardia sp.]
LDASDLELTTELDGEVCQNSRTSLMLHDIPKVIEWITAVMTLLPGDVILTGTPEGVGPVTDGQTVSVTVQGIGTLTNPVAAKR